MKKEVSFARDYKDGLPEKRPLVKRSIDESAHCVEFLYLRVCHQGHSVIPVDEILVRRELFVPKLYVFFSKCRLNFLYTGKLIPFAFERRSFKVRKVSSTEFWKYSTCSVFRGIRFYSLELSAS